MLSASVEKMVLGASRDYGTQNRMLGSVKSTIRRCAEKCGYTIVPNWALDTYPIARYMRTLFEFLSIDLVLDVGANQGQYHDFLRDQVGYQNRIISFEPVPHLAANLKERAASSSHWQVEARALGSRAGSLAFNVMQNTEMSSFLRPDHTSVGNLLQHHNKVENVVEVEVTSIDAILPSLITTHQSQNVYLKIDTQGFDLEVLKGAINSLPRLAALQTEASVIPLYVGMPRYHQVIQFLEDRGFIVSGIYPNNFVFFPRLPEFDCYMINRTRVV